MAHQPPSYGHPGSGPTPYPPNAPLAGNPSYLVTDNAPPPYPAGTNPPYNPYMPYEDKSFSTAPLISQNPPPLNYSSQQPPYQSPPPPMQYSAVPQPQGPNIAALNSVPNRNWGGSYGPGWYRSSSASRKKICIIFGVAFGLTIAVFIIVFVTLIVKAQNEHEAFHKKHFGH